MSDIINPAHYKGHPSGVECINVSRFLGSSLGNAFKYVFRAGQKGPALDDYRKALWYVDDWADCPMPIDPQCQAPLVQVMFHEPDALRKAFFNELLFLVSEYPKIGNAAWRRYDSTRASLQALISAEKQKEIQR